MMLFNELFKRLCGSKHGWMLLFILFQFFYFPLSLRNLTGSVCSTLAECLFGSNHLKMDVVMRVTVQHWRFFIPPCSNKSGNPFRVTAAFRLVLSDFFFFSPTRIWCQQKLLSVNTSLRNPHFAHRSVNIVTGVQWSAIQLWHCYLSNLELIIE